mgnify:CR=1 FL=1
MKRHLPTQIVQERNQTNPRRAKVQNKSTQQEIRIIEETPDRRLLEKLLLPAAIRGIQIPAEILGGGSGPVDPVGLPGRKNLNPVQRELPEDARNPA